MAKSYGQFCSLARALDHVGDRWSLLIVRELLIGPCRYSDLRQALPGVATNLLADRLRQMEADGLVSRRELAPPAASTVYELTPLGAALDQAVYAMIRWGAIWMVTGRGEDAFEPRWLILALRAFGGRVPAGVRGVVDVLVGEDRIRVTARAGGVTVAAATGSADVDATVSGAGETVLAVAAGVHSLAAAIREGALRVTGDRAVARRVLELFNLDLARVAAGGGSVG